MSGVYIPGLAMPKDCPMCPLSYWTWGGVFRGCNIVSGKKYAMDDPAEYASSNKRPEWCPLIPVPEHGEILRVLKTERECVGRDCDRDCGKCDLSLERDEIVSVYDALIAMFDPADKEGEG